MTSIRLVLILAGTAILSTTGILAQTNKTPSVHDPAIISPPPISENPPRSAVDPAAANGGVDDKYRIGFQDTLEIQVFRHPELTQRLAVNGNGTINLFRINKPVVAVCKTERELGDEIAALYEKDYLRNPFVNVVAIEQKSQSFAVIGAVQKPGHFFINRRLHLLELLALAGGPDIENVGSRLVIARTGSSSDCKQDVEAENANIQMFNFKLIDIQEGKKSFWMQPGDVVSVLDADIVYVYGNVEKQGAVKIKDKLSLTQAITLAEGLKSATNRGKIRVIRQIPGSLEREEFSYDLAQIDKGAVPDPFLQPNDIVAVSEDKLKSIINSVGTALTQGIPSILYRFP